MPTKNPYPKGSARAKLWARREIKRKAKLEAEKLAKKKKKKSKKDTTRRRAYLDQKIDG